MNDRYGLAFADDGLSFGVAAPASSPDQGGRQLSAISFGSSPLIISAAAESACVTTEASQS